MSNPDTFKFVEQALSDIAKDPDSGIVASAIPDIIALLERYPDLSIRGAAPSMKRGLETIIGDLHTQGKLH